MTADEAIKVLREQVVALAADVASRGHEARCARAADADTLAQGCTCGLRRLLEPVCAALRQTSRHGTHCYSPADGWVTCLKCGARPLFPDSWSACAGEEGL